MAIQPTAGSSGQGEAPVLQRHHPLPENTTPTTITEVMKEKAEEAGTMEDTPAIRAVQAVLSTETVLNAETEDTTATSVLHIHQNVRHTHRSVRHTLQKEEATESIPRRERREGLPTDRAVLLVRAVPTVTGTDRATARAGVTAGTMRTKKAEHLPAAAQATASTGITTERKAEEGRHTADLPTADRQAADLATGDLQAVTAGATSTTISLKRTRKA